MSYDDAPPPSQWARQVDRLRNLADSLDTDELLVLSWHVRSRLAWLTRRQEITIDTSNLSGRVLDEAERHNDEVRRRVGSRLQRAATSLEQARGDQPFQRLLRTAMTGANPPTKGA